MELDPVPGLWAPRAPRRSWDCPTPWNPSHRRFLDSELIEGLGWRCFWSFLELEYWWTLMNIDDNWWILMIDLLKDFPFSISPDVNFLFPFSSCTRAWCATGTLPKKFFLTSDVGCKQTLDNLRFENYCFFLNFGMFFWICVAVRAVCLFHGANRCIPWLPFIFQSFKRFLGV